MEVPPISHRMWTNLTAGKSGIAFECLALRVLLGRMLAVPGEPSPATLAKNAATLREMFVKNAHLPSLQRDLAKAFR